MTNKYQTSDVSRASFQIEGSFALFRHLQTAGSTEYVRENFQGHVVESMVNPTISFDSFVEQEVKKILDERSS